MKAVGKKEFYKPDYDDVLVKAIEFLGKFSDPTSMDYDEKQSKFKYMHELQRIANKQSKRLDIYIEDLRSYFNDSPELVDRMVSNTVSYLRVFQEAADRLLPSQSVFNDDDGDYYYDLILQQRQANHEQNRDLNDGKQRIPAELKRNYDLYLIRDLRDAKMRREMSYSVRELNSSYIGSLVCVRAMVVRVSDVKPQMLVATYNCDVCGYELYQVIETRKYAPLMECTSQKCVSNKIRGKVIINQTTSKFIPCQELKIQELTDQLPQGSIPRAFTVLARGENNIRLCSPGDIVSLQGVFLPIQSESYMSRTLMFQTFIEAFQIMREKKKYADFDLNNDIQLRIQQETSKQSFYQEFYPRLSRSIAPEIYGMDDVKKALLLMMVSGVANQRDDMRIRGDINIALIGDPGVAKSQLLKHIASVSPRGIYTTGKGSSSVGLTAAVIKDEVTNEMTLEGGALVMADMGVCCIDEFDKMNETDRTAIHEVMEQQTVSIAKAGITTTLNARTSILAAANPLYGRYNKKFTPHKNINLPAALLSRFDLIFILIDQPDTSADELLARHIGYVHRNLHAPKTDFQPYDLTFMKNYVAKAKSYSPTISPDLHEFISQRYVDKRSEQKTTAKEGYSYTTPRTLLGIIRLSTALAKLRFSNAVTQEDVDEALRLMEVSQSSVQEAMEDSTERKHVQDKTSQIFSLLKELCQKIVSRTIQRSTLEKKIVYLGFTSDDLIKCLDLYKALNVIMVSETGNQITLVQ